MSQLDSFFDEIDLARLRRARELSELKRSFELIVNTDVYGVASKAVVVLTYASWEGFYNDCVETYIKFLAERGGKVRDSDWSLLICALQAEFDSLRDRNHSLESRRFFLSRLETKIESSFDSIDSKIVKARSNLNFARLSENYAILNIDVSGVERIRIRLDRELVGWRHAVAHGDSPDLSKLSVDEHISFASALLLMVADSFQYAMLKRF